MIVSGIGVEYIDGEQPNRYTAKLACTVVYNIGTSHTWSPGKLQQQEQLTPSSNPNIIEN